MSHLPKVTRPRVVKDPHNPTTQWKCEGGEFYWRGGEGGWWGLRNGFTKQPNVTLERVMLLADLLDNPTEEVEEES